MAPSSRRTTYLLVQVQHGAEVAVGKEDAAAEETVRFVARDGFESLHQGGVQSLRPKLGDEPVIVDGTVRLYSPGVNGLRPRGGHCCCCG